jgi:hypothetical protein
MTFKQLIRVIAFLLTSLVMMQSQAQLLDDPISMEVSDFAQNSIWAFQQKTALATIPQPVEGWPTLYASGDWYFQYPPDWVVQNSGVYWAHVSDNRGLANLIFLELDEVVGCPSLEEAANTIIYEKLNSPGSIYLIASDYARLAGTEMLTSETGDSLFWVFRWIDPQAGKMIGTLNVMMVGRAAFCQNTIISWSFAGFPEAELDVAYTQIGPMTDSFVFIKGGGGCDWDDPDLNENGIPDCKEGGG